MGNFVHLHLHTEYSMLDGMSRISVVTKKAAKLGMPAIAITDHGNMYGAVAFFDACEKNKIKPIFGTEFYVCDDLHVHSKNKVDTNDEGYKDRRHLILLAKDEIGYKNICELNSIAWNEGFYFKPRIDLKALEQYHEGLICLSACIGGEIPQAIMHHNFEEAERLVQWFKNLFGEDFYLEMQNHGMEEEIFVNSYLRLYAKKYNVKLVCTNDVHYINKEDAEAQDILMCVQTGSFYDDEKRMKMPCNEFYLKTYDEMVEAFPEDVEAIENTMEIVEKCNFKFEYGKYMFPHYKPENGDDPETYINKLIDEGIQKKCGGIRTKEIDDRIKMELGVIKKQGFIEYFLIVWDYINAARRMGISVGPGRGSGAGSMVAYLIGITDIDPLKYNLYFERFLNSERVSAPDFDVDFEDSRRPEVIEYVKRKYGADSVCRIITFGTMAAKNAIKDVGRVLRIPYAELDKVTKILTPKIMKNGNPIDLKRPYLAKVIGQEMPSEKDLKEGITDYIDPAILEIYQSNPDIKKVIDLAIKLEDMPRQYSTHACGVIIGADILHKHMPLAVSTEKELTSQYTGVELEHLGFLKMDFLGLRNLTDIKMAIQYVKENRGIDVVFNRDGYDDPKVFDLISSGNTTAIFQIESDGFKNFLSNLKPNCLEDIVAAVSLFRPGPMDSIPRFIDFKHNPEHIVYDHPLLEPILSQTYGCIVYQEQVMKIVQELAGYTLGRADIVRRYMGKKKVAEMEKEQVIFVHGQPEMVDDHGKVTPAIDGCLKRGVPEEVAIKVWNEMKDFAKYAFNKSHAAAYSVVTYQTAYLKCYFEPEFLTAVLNNRITNIKEIINYVEYAKDEGIKIFQPDINESKTFFSVNGKDIRFGLAAVKNVGIGVIDLIIEERTKNGKFKSFEDFIVRCITNLNKRMVANLIKAGAFDCFGKHRSQLLLVHELAIDQASSMNKGVDDNQLSLFDLLGEPNEIHIDYPDVDEWNDHDKYDFEKEACGLYITGHPLARYAAQIKNSIFNSEKFFTYIQEDGEEEFSKICNFNDGDKVSMIGMIKDSKKTMTKKGDEMMLFKAEDLFGTVDCVCFPKNFAKLKEKIVTDTIVRVSGRIIVKDENTASLSVDDIEEMNEVVAPKKEAPQVMLCLRATEEVKEDILDIVMAYPGDIPVYMRIGDKRYMLSQKVRKCNGIISELQSVLNEEDIVFFEKK